METGMVSRIQRFSTGDGPGIRTTVFLKGCNLHCAWCHNPETWSRDPQLLFYAARCTGCGRCAMECPTGAHTLEDGVHHFDRNRCTGCGACAAACPAQALQWDGQELTVDDVLRVIDEDSAFYRASGGGVTLSGGEPLLQPAFCTAVAAGCRERGIPVLIDTAGDVPYEAFRQVLPYADSVYFDLKGADPADVAARTGADLARILGNLKRLTAARVAVTARIPVIPGHTDRDDTCQAMAARLREAGVTQVCLLPFHRLGAAKYRALGRPYPYADTSPPARETLEALARAFDGLHVSIES